jgi:hypothetical protein
MAWRCTIFAMKKSARRLTIVAGTAGVTLAAVVLALNVTTGEWVSVGSTNFDNRSFRLNDEANLNIYDAEFARRSAALLRDQL